MSKTTLLAAFVAVSVLQGGGPAAAATPEPAPAASSAAAPALEAGDQISVGERLSSPNGQFHLAVQVDGNAVLYATRTDRARWATNTLGAPAQRLVMQPDGNLVLYGADNVALWASDTAGNPQARLALGDDGTLALAWPGGERILTQPASELTGGDTLVPGQSLTSPTGRFTLVLQEDGNLVEIESGTGPVWASGTRGDNQVVLDPGGDLSVRSADAPSDPAQWSTGTDAPGARLVVQDDGNIVLYAGSTVVWSRGDEEREQVAADAVAASSLQIATAAAVTTTATPRDDYPNRDAVACGSGVYCENGSQYSARGFAYRNCTDFVAWKIGLPWSQIADGSNGHAAGWKQGWISRGRSVGTAPQVGAVAWWDRGSYGHVAYVVAVNPDGSAVVEQYNAGGTGEFSIQTVRADSYLY